MRTREKGRCERRAGKTDGEHRVKVEATEKILVMRWGKDPAASTDT